MSGVQKRPITRNREMLACTECRRRKLKCDRSSPCGSCVRRGDEGSCEYQRYSRGAGNERERRLEAESRLQHLEQLVQQLAKPGPSSGSAVGSGPGSGNATSAQSDKSSSSNGTPPGTLSQSGAYSGSTHWSAMLEDIEELRFAMGTDDMAADVETTSPLGAVDVLFGAGVTLSLQQILSQFLPPRQETDRHIAAYFRAKAVAAPFIHGPQFQRQYQAFWQDPSRAPPLWTSMLFTICYIATSTLAPQNENDTEIGSLAVAAAHCLAIGGYTRPKRFAVEAILLFIQSQLFTTLDIPPYVATVMPLIIRLASKLGYHREPTNFSMPAFEKEMRRRTWSLCLQLDLLVAFQFGLPSTVQYPTWDTRPPSNFLDTDFDEDTEVLPTPRPDAEITDILFYNGKHKLVIPFEKVIRNSLSTSEEADMQVDELDAEIRQTYALLPKILLPRPMAESVVDPPYLTSTRLCVAFMYQKCLCVLHRRYVTQGRTASIQTCYEASTELTRLFVDAYGEFRPGGQNESERWFFSSITWHDFLLGTTCLCLVVCVLSQRSFGIDVNSTATLNLLRRCQQTCSEQSDRNLDTQRAIKVIGASIALFESQIDQVQSEASLSADQPMLIPPARVGYQNTARNSNGQGGTDSSAAFNWGWEEEMPGASDPGWAYFEQFFNFQADEPMSGL